jgi:hypothetical protein
MMGTVAELEAVIAQTPSGEQVQFDTKLIGSVDHVTRKLTELKLNRSGDTDYLIFVGLDRFGECFLAAFSTIGDPLEFRARHEKQLDRATQGLLPIGLLPRDDGGIISSAAEGEKGK